MIASRVIEAVALCILAISIVQSKDLPDDFCEHGFQTEEELQSNLGAMLRQPLAEGLTEEEAILASQKRVFLDSKNEPLPTNFDARTKWPECPSIRDIYTQSGCGSCWAISTASANSDRTCIASGGNFTSSLSAIDLLTCCRRNCGFGCRGGYVEQAMIHFKTNGIVTGGTYESIEAGNGGCKPYTFEPCLVDCKTIRTPKCKDSCQKDYKKGYYQDKHFASEAFYVIGGEENIMREIYENGPVVAVYNAYPDVNELFCEPEKVYRHVRGRQQGAHAVRVIGWGLTEREERYWLIANSWGREFGMEGVFRFRRGVNECGIESYVVAATPKPVE